MTIRSCVDSTLWQLTEFSNWPVIHKVSSVIFSAPNFKFAFSISIFTEEVTQWVDVLEAAIKCRVREIDRFHRVVL